MAATTSIKSQARQLIDQLPDDAQWEDLLYRIYVRESIEAGIRDDECDQVIPVEEIRKEYGLA